jgi:hypothetical protein
MALLSSSDYENLPNEPELRWLKLRDMLENRLDLATEYGNGPSDHELIEYCSTLYGAAQELSVGHLDDFSVGNIRESYVTFRASVISLATRLSLRIRTDQVHSIALRSKTKRSIFQEIERLRAAISHSDLDDAKRELIEAKLDELQVLVFSDRTDFNKVIKLLMFLGAALVDTTAFLADAPSAIGTITSLIGVERAEQEEPKKIDREKSPLQIEDRRNNSSLDDEIPF